MASIADIVANGFNGVYPPVTTQYTIKQYLTHSDAINALEYLNTGVSDGQNGLIVSVREDTTKAYGQTRAFGTDYVATNYVPTKRTLNLHPCGDQFIDDDGVGRQVGAYREFSFAKAMENSINTFLKNLILGDETTYPTQFNGLEKQIDSSMILADEIDVSALTMDKLIQVEDGINTAFSMMQGSPNILITSARTAAKLGTLNSMRYRFQSVINFGDRQYMEYQRTRVVILDDECFVPEDLAKGVVYALDMNVRDGVYISVPSDGTLVKVYRPVATGTPVNKGTVEIISTPVVLNHRKLLKFFLNDNPN